MQKQKSSSSDNKETLTKRPPIVAVLGHVDHGKTTLLDYIRKTKVAAEEAGGITQRIGAYKIEKPAKITFIDTPGHKAFSAMRSRGANVADIAILVVAADDSVKAQTIESIKYMKEAKIPLVVAINKIDLPEIDPDKVKKDLLQAGVSCEGYGGDTVAVEVSAKSGKGVDDLLEMIGLIAQMKNIVANSKQEFKGVVIESVHNKRQGPLITILVKNGTLNIRDEIIAGGVSARVKAIFNELGQKIDSAYPSDPVVVLGFSDIAPVGTIVRTKLSKKKNKINPVKQIQTDKKECKKEIKIVKFIVKAGTLGELEAVLKSLPSQVDVIDSGVGDITESDIEYAIATNSAVVGFNINISSAIAKLAERENIVVRTYKIIYKLLEEINKVVAELTRVPKEVITGRAKVLAKFTINSTSIAGVRVEEGKIKIADKVKVENEGQVSRGKVISIKQKKTELKEAIKGEEYGIGVSKSLDFSKGSVIIAYNII